MIWIERNNRIFEGKEEEKEWLWEGIRFVASLWASNSKLLSIVGWNTINTLNLIGRL
ncbi:hypothetical protein LguiA_007795 [Lonicera macranthoides]